jgi:non-specific protein-tyrosine kinase
LALRTRRGLVDPGSPSAEPFRTLRLALQLRPDGRSRRVLLFSSSEAGEGKSTLAANFALVSAASDSVLIMDGDLRRPRLHDLYDLPRAPGMVEVLAGQSTIDEVAQPVPGVPRLNVLTAGAAIPRPGDLAASRRMAAVLAEASAKFDLVVVDSPPILSAADAAGFASHPDVAVVVVVKRPARGRTLRRSLRELELIDADIAGLVVNRDGRLTGYSYTS